MLSASSSTSSKVISSEQRSRLERLAATTNFALPACGHSLTRSTATRIVHGAATIICHACFAIVAEQDRAARVQAMPMDADIACMFCDARPSRMDKDLQLGICDRCRKQNERLSEESEALHGSKPSDALPD